MAATGGAKKEESCDGPSERSEGAGGVESSTDHETKNELQQQEDAVAPVRAAAPPMPTDDVVGVSVAAEKLPFEEEAVQAFGGMTLFGETTSRRREDVESLESSGKGNQVACSSRSSQSSRSTGAVDPMCQVDEDTYKAKLRLLYRRLEVAEPHHSPAEVVSKHLSNYMTVPERDRFLREHPQCRQYVTAADDEGDERDVDDESTRQ